MKKVKVFKSISRLDTELVIKIAGFSHAMQSKVTKSNKLKDEKEQLNARWMSIETLCKSECSSKSDVIGV